MDHPGYAPRHGTGLAGTPEGTARGGLVVVQEIFGANPHIRAVAERFAAEGYAVLAPSFFDLVDGPDADRMPCPTTPTA